MFVVTEEIQEIKSNFQFYPCIWFIMSFKIYTVYISLNNPTIALLQFFYFLSFLLYFGNYTLFSYSFGFFTNWPFLNHFGAQHCISVPDTDISPERN